MTSGDPATPETPATSPHNDPRRDAVPPLRFLKSQHLRRPADFQRVFDLKQRASDDRLLIFAASNDLGHTRIGLSVSRKHGNAVRRHRLQRLLREAFRLSQHDLPPGLDLILIPHAGTGPTASVDGYRRSLQHLSRKLARRITATPQEPPP